MHFNYKNLKFYIKKTNSETELVFKYKFKFIVNYKVPATAF